MQNKLPYRHINECRLCKSHDLEELIDFDNVPLGNNLLTNKNLALHVDEYPLKVMRCKACNHFQLNCAVNPNTLYAINYTYLSGVGLSFINHIKNYVKWIEKKTNISKSSVIVDVGSNDGTCLENFKKKGYTVCGVDPAKLAVEISRKKNIFTINNFFNEESCQEILDKFGKVDLITSQNVLAHVDDIRFTFKKIYDLLKQGGYFVFEVGYFKNVLELGTFDTIYHEHIDYHHASPLVKFLSSIGFSVIEIENNNIQGGSIRLLLRKTGQGLVSKSAVKFLLKEKKAVIYDEYFLKNWSNKIKNNISQIKAIINKEKEKGIPCFAYGSPTKAVLLLKTAELSTSDIQYIVEDNKYKVGKFLPKISLPILPVDQLDFEKRCLIIILAWNFSDDIINKLRKLFNVPFKVIIPIPQLKILDL